MSTHLTTLLFSPRESWFNQKDVDDLKAVGINTVRIPVRVSERAVACSRLSR